VRPLSDDELKDSNGNTNGTDNSIIEIVSDQLLAVTKGSELIPFELDTVWGYDANQADVFEDVEPLIAAVASGMMDGLRSNDHLRGCLCLSAYVCL
jgi:hypothetical protein